MDVVFGRTDKAPVNRVGDLLDFCSVTSAAAFNFHLKRNAAFFCKRKNFVYKFFSGNTGVAQTDYHTAAMRNALCNPCDVGDECLPDVVFFIKKARKISCASAAMLFPAAESNCTVSHRFTELKRIPYTE